MATKRDPWVIPLSRSGLPSLQAEDIVWALAGPPTRRIPLAYRCPKKVASHFGIPTNGTLEIALWSVKRDDDHLGSVVLEGIIMYRAVGQQKSELTAARPGSFVSYDPHWRTGYAKLAYHCDQCDPQEKGDVIVATVATTSATATTSADEEHRRLMRAALLSRRDSPIILRVPDGERPTKLVSGIVEDVGDRLVTIRDMAGVRTNEYDIASIIAVIETPVPK